MHGIWTILAKCDPESEKVQAHFFQEMYKIAYICIEKTYLYPLYIFMCFNVFNIRFYVFDMCLICVLMRFLCVSYAVGMRLVCAWNAMKCVFIHFYAFFSCVSMRFHTLHAFQCVSMHLVYAFVVRFVYDFHVVDMWLSVGACGCMWLLYFSMRFYTFLCLFICVCYMAMRRMNYARNMRLYLFAFRVTYIFFFQFPLLFSNLLRDMFFFVGFFFFPVFFRRPRSYWSYGIII